MYTYKANSIFFNGREIHSFNGNVEEILTYKDKCIILYRLSDEFFKKASIDEMYGNIVSLDEKGNLIWRISPPIPGVGASGPDEYTSLSYFNETLHETFSKGYWAYGGGNMHRFEPETGTILEHIFTK